MKWNSQQIQSAMLQSILQGESIPKMAKRIANTVGDSNRKASIRNARTLVTGVQNTGRLDAYKRGRDKYGIENQKCWLATHDNSTRHSHRQIDYETVDLDMPFSNGCMEPGDPEGRPEEIYNCRCTMRSIVKGFELRSRNHGDMTRVRGM